MPTSLISRMLDEPVQYYSQGLRGRFQVDALRNPMLQTFSKAYAAIDYEFSQEDYEGRTEAVLRAGHLETHLPYGFPESVKGRMTWSGADFANDESYVVHLTDEWKVEIQSALDHFLSLGIPNTEVNPSNFPLPTLGPRLVEIRNDVYYGRGFAILRGLDVDSFDNDNGITVSLGITSYVAPTRGKQNQRGDMIMHVINTDEDDVQSNKTVEKPFHTDTVCDVLCLFTKACASVGGRSIMSSVGQVYNELAATRPDIIHALTRPNWPFDTILQPRPPLPPRRQDPHELLPPPPHRLPPRDPRTPGIPGLTERQAEALDAVHAIARAHEIRTVMQKGDIRFLNNMGLLHRRESFEDAEGADRRHLVRLWLHNQDHCWKLPAPLRLAWARVFEDEERETHWTFDPVGADGKVLRSAVSCD
ncbi:unnamed protein product [Parascedosporium putredinis]|uniref:TauD/TfdA-like domain-containing protein n=1 Tax=Parascedosporium putredinis TaxID=1442378 RepID=A0A9P1MBF0_9PEZI|nr:unnamed protein product [Parascedosporium putredinis]CAI7995782.1 unnamed protein product [Parascedosporium putredinis]